MARLIEWLGRRPGAQTRRITSNSLYRFCLCRRSRRLDFSFFTQDFFALAGAGGAFAFFSLAQRAFTAALIFAFAAAESLRPFLGLAAFMAGVRVADRSALPIVRGSPVTISCS
jgi:hypothetical protein